MQVCWIDFEDVSEAEYNPRKDLLPGDAEWRQIEASLDEYGQVEPLVYNQHNHRLIGGHQRMKILRHKGATGAYMSVVTIPDEAREKALNVALNQGGQWDLSKLNTLMGDLDAAGLGRIAGFSPDDIRRMTGELERQRTLDVLAGGAPDRDEDGNRPGVGYRDASISDAYVFNLPLAEEQRRVVFEAITIAKELWGSPTTQQALAEVCRFFTQHAEQERIVGD